MAAISYDPVPVLADFPSAVASTFPLLSDSGSAVIRAYGILNTTVPATNQRTVRHPVSWDVHRERQRCRDVARLRSGISGARHDFEHHDSTGRG